MERWEEMRELSTLYVELCVEKWVKTLMNGRDSKGDKRRDRKPFKGLIPVLFRNTKKYKTR